MTTLYKDKCHLVVATEKNGLYIIWIRVGNPVSRNKKFASWEIAVKFAMTPFGLYEDAYKGSLMKVTKDKVFNSVKSLIKTHREIEKISLAMPDLSEVQSYIEKTLAQTNPITRGANIRN